jgi:hypothetical protein
MANIIPFDGLLANDEATDMADLACLGHVSRVRITQIISLSMLDQDVQEVMLFLFHTEATRDALKYTSVGSLSFEPDWNVQLKMCRHGSRCLL